MAERIFIIICIVLGVFGGLGAFLSPSDQLRPVDAIVAISGDRGLRYQQALQLYNQGISDNLIFSGAAKDPASPSNALVMKRKAIASGVPEEAIYIDETSYSTRENARNVARIIAEQNFDSIVLVTSPYHQRRASLEFSWALGERDVNIINYSTDDDDRWHQSLWWASPRGWYYSSSETGKIALTLLQRLFGATGEPI